MNCYSNGQKALLFNENGSGQTYYPSGRVAAVVASSRAENGIKFQFYFYQDNNNSTLVASLDEHAVGCVESESGEKLVLTKTGGIMSDSDGKICANWKWNRRAQGAGILPAQPVKLRVNDNITVIFADRSTISTQFKCEGISKEFNCGQQLRRPDSYLTGAIRSGNGKLVPNAKFKSLQDTQNESKDEIGYLRNLNRSHSSNIKHSDQVKTILEGLEDHFETYHGKIRNNDFGSTFIHGDWKGEARSFTHSQVPRILATGQETGALPEDSDLGCTVDSLERHQSSAPDKWPSEFEVREQLKKEHPLLPRSKMIRSASGRYSTSLPCDTSHIPDCKKLPSLDPSGFESAINDTCLVAVVCLREDDPQCVYARQLFERVNAKVSSNNNPESKVYQFEMSHSRYLTEKFGVHTLPAFLVFKRQRLVAAHVMGARPCNLVREKLDTRVLIVEPTNFKSQIQIERQLKKLYFKYDLAISTKDALSCMQFRNGIDAANATTYYGIIFIDSSMDVHQARSIATLARKNATSALNGAVLVVSLLRMGERMHAGVVKNPTNEQLIDSGICDIAISRPLKSVSMEAISVAYLKHLASTKGEFAADQVENVTHYGFKQSDILREMRNAKEASDKGLYLQQGFKLGMKLSISNAKYKAVNL